MPDAEGNIIPEDYLKVDLGKGTDFFDLMHKDPNYIENMRKAVTMTSDPWLHLYLNTFGEKGFDVSS
jgi:hypothetical protein